MTSSKNILVCVTQQKTCERLIKKAADLRDNLSGELFIIHVAKEEWNFLDNVKEGEALQYLFEISKSVGASLSVLRSDNIVNTIVEYVNKNRIELIIMGGSKNTHKENDFYSELSSLLSNVEINIVN